MTAKSSGETTGGDVERIAREIADVLAAVATSLPDGAREGPASPKTSDGSVAAFDLGGPRTMLENGARFVAPVLPADATARRLKALVLRALRIVTRDQTVFNSAILEALRIAFRQIEQGIGEDRRRQARVAAGLEQRLDSGLARSSADLRTGLESISDGVDARLGTEAAAREALGTTVSGAERRLDLLEREAGRRGPEIDRVTGTASGLVETSELLSRRLAALAGELRAVRLEWTSLRADLGSLRAAATPLEGGRAGAAAMDPSDPLRAGLYMDFEEAFRGTEEEIGRRQALDVPLFRDAPGPVADLGCGRGEFLAALGAAGIEGIGCDANPMMAARGREKGLAVDRADLFDWLSARPDGSLGGLVAYQVVEHLPSSALFTLVEMAARKLAPGGRLLLETVNPESVYAMKWFWMDLTHVRPVPAPSLARLLEASGFRDVTIDYRSPVPAEDALPQPVERDPAFAPIARLLFAPQDIAVTGLR